MARGRRKEKGGHGRKGGPGTHGGRGTLTPAGSPLPFPYTAAPASPGPAPASVWRAVDTRPCTRLAPHTMGFSHHQHHSKLLNHDYSHRGMFGCVYTEMYIRSRSHTAASLS